MAVVESLADKPRAVRRNTRASEVQGGIPGRVERAKIGPVRIDRRGTQGFPEAGGRVVRDEDPGTIRPPHGGGRHDVEVLGPRSVRPHSEPMRLLELRVPHAAEDPSGGYGGRGSGPTTRAEGPDDREERHRRQCRSKEARSDPLVPLLASPKPMKALQRLRI